jgi:hypothetical protein
MFNKYYLNPATRFDELSLPRANRLPASLKDRGSAALNTSYGMGVPGDLKEDFYTKQRAWGITNKEVGEKASSSLITSFFTGLVTDYLSILEDSPALNIVKKIFTGFSSSFEGLRDHLMYEHLYGQGISSNLTKAETIDQKAALKSEKVPFLDDVRENLLQQELFEENIVGKTGELATIAARVKPFGNLITSLLPTEYKRFVDTIVDLPAKCYWRLRFFGGSLHANFVTTAVNLVKHGVGSMVSSTSREKYTTLKKELHEKSAEYFKDKGLNDVANTGESSSLSLYFKMLQNRLGEHWKAFRNPEAAISEKLEKGIISKEDNVSAKRQKLASITDLTAPFCAAFGLIGTIVFDPLSKIAAIANIETGRNLLNAAASSRKLFQLANYIPRFMLPEWRARKKADEYAYAVTGEGANDPKLEVARQLYYAHKARGQNALLGFVVAALNISEPFAHLFGFANSESRLVKFMFSALQRVGDTGFLQFFTKRRQHLGEENFALSFARELDYKQYDKRVAMREDLSAVDLTGVDHTLEDLNKIAKETMDKTGIQTNNVLHDTVINPVIRATRNLSSKETVIPQRELKWGFGT